MNLSVAFLQNSYSLSHAGALCPYNYDDEFGTFSWTIIWCPPGEYVEEGKGQTISDCEPCPPGHFCPGEGEIFACYKTGEVCEAGCVDRCYICPDGQFANVEHTKCMMCPTGSYGTTGFHCEQCPAGTYGDTPGLAHKNCSGLCEMGHFCPLGSSSSKENQCPGGTFGNTIGLATPECDGLCEVGAWCSPGSIHQEGLPCGSGRYGNRPGQTSPACSGPCSPEHWCAPGMIILTLSMINKSIEVVRIIELQEAYHQSI